MVNRDSTYLAHSLSLLQVPKSNIEAPLKVSQLLKKKSSLWLRIYSLFFEARIWQPRCLRLATYITLGKSFDLSEREFYLFIKCA